MSLLDWLLCLTLIYVGVAILLALALARAAGRADRWAEASEARLMAEAAAAAIRAEGPRPYRTAPASGRTAPAVG